MAALAAGGIAVSGPAGAAPASGVQFTILPPGNGYINGPLQYHANDQTAMYDGLENPVAAGTLTDADLKKYFKDQRIGALKASDVVRTETPRPGVTIKWDRFGVPHINGVTAEDVAFGAGWTVAEARLLILVIARIFGRSGLIEQVGNADRLIEALGALDTTPLVSYSEAELQSFIDRTIADAGPQEGPQILSAIGNYTDGINEWLQRNPVLGPDLAKLGLTFPEPFRPTDVVASAIVVGNIFGAGGGNEVNNLRALQSLLARFGNTKGKAIYDDLRMRDNRDATVHIDTEYPYPLTADSAGATPVAAGPEDPASIARLDPGSVTTLPNVNPPKVAHSSNSIAISADRSKSGHPIMVGGPQAAYVFPELLFEWELTGGGFESSGVTFPGIGPFVVIGHTRNYAWTATSGDSDLVDQRVEKLCNVDGSPARRDSRAYWFNGVCTPMTRPDNNPQTMWRTVHGPVTGSATVNGEPVAIARQRASFGEEAHSARALWRLSRNEVRNATDFASTMGAVPFSFNWTYVNDKDIAYFHSGWYPVRKAGAAFDFPTWGTGEWEWQGLLDFNDFSRNPQAVNPPSGQIVSWNSKPAPGWSEADNKWGVGSVQRVDLLAKRVEGLKGATPAQVTAAAQDAATADLRGERVVSQMLAVLAGSPAPNAQLEQVRQLLTKYSQTGAHRRDRNFDWIYDDPMTGFTDQLYDNLVHAMFDRVLGAEYMADGGPRQPDSLDNAPSSSGSAFNSPTWYSITARELDRARGAAVRPANVPAMCGRGSRVACRRILWNTLKLTYWQMQQYQLPWVRDDITKWQQSSAPERIRFLPYVFNGDSMRWSNRPTFQQVISYG